MSTQIGLFHTTLNAVNPVVAVLRQRLPEAKLVHYLDEGMLARLRQGATEAELGGRLLNWMHTAAHDGCQGMLLTCSSFTPLFQSIRPQVTIPAVPIDEAMIQAAVRTSGKLGLIATLPSAIDTARQLLEAEAKAQGVKLELTTALAEGAFDALSAGDLDTHNAKVRAAIERLLPQVDAILLAQVSMSRVLGPEAHYPKPVFTSAPLAIDALLGQMQTLPA